MKSIKESHKENFVALREKIKTINDVQEIKKHDRRCGKFYTLGLISGNQYDRLMDLCVDKLIYLELGEKPGSLPKAYI